MSQILKRKICQRKVSSGFGSVEIILTFKTDKALRNVQGDAVRTGEDSV